MADEVKTSTPEEGQAEAPAQTADNAEAPETGKEQVNTESGKQDYEKQYNELRPAFTRQAQELAEYKRREKESAVAQMTGGGQEEDLPDFLKNAPQENIEAYKTLESAVLAKARMATLPVYLDSAITWAKTTLKGFDETNPQLIETVRAMSGARFSNDPLSDMKRKLEVAYKSLMADSYKQQGAEEARELDKAKRNSSSLERGGTTGPVEGKKLTRDEVLRKAIREKLSKQ